MDKRATTGAGLMGLGCLIMLAPFILIGLIILTATLYVLIAGH